MLRMKRFTLKNRPAVKQMRDDNKPEIEEKLYSSILALGEVSMENYSMPCRMSSFVSRSRKTCPMTRGNARCRHM